MTILIWNCRNGTSSWRITPMQRKLAMYLGDIDADDDDPLVGLYYGLQARTQL